MLKVIIVDDEIIVRVGLKACIEWAKIGYEVVGMAENGNQAMNMVEDLQPDLIFTDIKMPGKDGLELISEVHKKYPYIKIIVLSCLNEIDYVKQAIKLGAEDYILKLSLKTDELEKILIKIKQDIDKGKINEGPAPDLSRENKYYIREHAYRRLLSNSAFPYEKKELFEQLGFKDTSEEKYILCCCTIDDYEHAYLKSKLEEHHLFKAALINILQEFLKEYVFSEVIEIDAGEYLILIKFKKDIQIMAEMGSYAQRLNSALTTHLDISASFGVSEPFESYRNLDDKYKEAKEAVSYKFFSGRKSFLIYKEHAACQGQAAKYITDGNLGDSLLEAVKIQSKDKVNKVIKLWTEGVLQNSGNVTPLAVRTTAIEAWLTLSRFIREKEIDEKSALSNSSENPSSVLMNIETLTDAGFYLETLACKLIDAIMAMKISRPEIEVLKKYIAEHMEENISLEEAARVCGISRTYFSSLFKKETGEHFSDYLNRVKMEKARELILLKNMRSSEAAYHVGIVDESYFSKLFRKYLGVNPSQLKKNR